MGQVLALGDCNTSGDIFFPGNAYPERVAEKLKLSLANCGFTMATTREMLAFCSENLDADTEVLLIQYGLVDSWKTFRYAPYVPYYPDSRRRKLGRKLTKKYKKIAKRIGLNRLLGVVNVVDQQEYRKNIERVIALSGRRIILLLDTAPNRQIERNNEIKAYNRVLDQVAERHPNCHRVRYYDQLEADMARYYLDDTHINDLGHDLVAERVIERLRQWYEKDTPDHR